MVYLADVNFLVALLHPRHAMSRRAVSWLAEQNPPPALGLCRVVQLGVLRVLTNASWLREDVQQAAAVWQAFDFLLADTRFRWLPEPEALETEWRRLTSPLPPGRCAETDLYLAAFARAGNYTLLTFDRGFLRLAEVNTLVLADE